VLYNIILKVVWLTFYLEGLEENDVAQKGTYRGVKYTVLIEIEFYLCLLTADFGQILIMNIYTCIYNV
jgi:hypothetical protein